MRGSLFHLEFAAIGKDTQDRFSVCETIFENLFGISVISTSNGEDQQ